MKVVADDCIPFLDGVFEPYNIQLVRLPGVSIGRQDLMDADALLTRTRTRCNCELLEGTSVKFIGSATIGFDHLDVAALDRLGIYWCNAPGCNANSVAQYVTGVICHCVPDWRGKVLGIVGVGNVGKAVERVGRALGMEILRNDPPRADREGGEAFVSLENLLEHSHVVSLHTPLVRDGKYPTWHLIGDEAFARMKPGTLLISAGRGEVVDSHALFRALQQGKCRAVLDVWENEPDIDGRLLSRLLAGTPHIAGYSMDGKANGSSMVLRELGNYFSIEALKRFSVAREQIPQVPDPVLDLSGMDALQGVRFAIAQSSHFAADAERLQRDISKFELWRKQYPLRREPCAWKVNHVPVGAENMLRNLGFQVEE